MPFSRVLPFAAYKEPPFSQKGSRAHLMQKYPKTLNISQEDMQEPFTVPSTVYADIFDIAPSGRWMHTMKMVGSKIYVFGGIASYGKAFLNDIWLRNEIMKRWDILQQNFIPPVPGRDSMQIPSLFGGQWQSQLDPSSTTSARPYSLPKPPPMRRAPFRTIDQRNQRERKGSIMYPDITKTSFPIGDMWQYDLDLKVWSSVAFTGDSTAVPEARFGHSSCVLNNEVIIFGGTSWRNELLSDIWAFNPNTLRWSRIHSNPSEHSMRLTGHSSIAFQSTMVVFGGSGYAGVLNGDVYEFSFETGEWTRISVSGPLPHPRWQHSAHLMGNMMIVFGGVVIDDARRSDTWLFDLVSRIWVLVEIDGFAPMPRGLAASAVEGNKMYVFGGNGGNYPYDDLWVLEISGSSGSWEEMLSFDIYPAARQGSQMVVITPPEPDEALETDPPAVVETMDEELRNPLEKSIFYRSPERARKKNVANRYLFLFGGAPPILLP